MLYILALLFCVALAVGAVFLCSNYGSINNDGGVNAEEVNIAAPVLPSGTPSAVGEHFVTVNDVKANASTNGYVDGTIPIYSNMSDGVASVYATNTPNTSNNNNWTDMSLKWAAKGISAYVELEVGIFVPAGATLDFKFRPNIYINTNAAVTYWQAKYGIIGDSPASGSGGFAGMETIWSQSHSGAASPVSINGSVTSNAVLTVTNNTSSDKIVSKYIGFWIIALHSGTPNESQSLGVGFGPNWDRKELVAPVPSKIEAEYDGNSKWITAADIQSKNSWIESSTWLAKDDSNNDKYLQVKKIEYTDGDGNKTDYGTDTTKIVEAGTYNVTVAMKGIRWKGGTTGEKSFIINVAQKDVGTLVPKIDYGTNDDGTTKEYYSGTPASGFPTISLPDGWDTTNLGGTIKWDDGQTLGETGDYNWTFTPNDKNYDKKTGTAQITVVPLAVKSISATLSGSAGNIYTSTSLTELLGKLTIQKTYNNSTEPVPAGNSEVKWATGTKLVAGDNVELTLEFKANAGITCTVTIPKVYAVVPSELSVSLNEGSTVYTSTSLDDLKTMLTVKEINNDGTDGETLTADQFTFPDGFALTSGTVTVTVIHTHGEGADAVEVSGDVSIVVGTAAVKKVEVTVNVPADVTLWEGVAANTIKQYLTVKATLDDGNETVKTLDPKKDNYTVTVIGNANNVLTKGNCAFTVTYGGKTSAVRTITVAEVLVDTLTATYVQPGTIYSSATVDDLQINPYLTVDAVFNNGDEETLDYSDYTVTIPKNFSSTNNTVTVTWQKGETTKTATFTVTVTDVDVSGVTATFTLPEGEKITAANIADDLKKWLVIELNYNNGDKKTLKATEYELSADSVYGENNDKLCAGERTITVRYDDETTTTFTVTVDKAAIDNGDIEFKPTGSGSGGGLTDDGNGGFTGTYSPSGDFGIDIDPDTLPDGVTVKTGYPVYKKWTGSGNPTYDGDGKPTGSGWTPLPAGEKPTGAGTYVVEIDFDYDEDNFDPIDPISAIIDIEKGDIDTTGAAPKPSGDDNGLTPGENGGYSGTYKPDGNYEIDVDSDTLPDGVTPKAPEYVKLKEGGDPDNPTDWIPVDKPDGAGTYKVVIGLEPDDKDNYNELDPIEVILVLSDKAVDKIVATVDGDAKFDARSTLDDLKAKIKAEIVYNNGTKDDLDADKFTLSCDGMADGRFNAGAQTVTVTYNDGTAEFTTTVDITVEKAKVALPVYTGKYGYTGSMIKPSVSDFDGFDDAVMIFVESKLQSGINVGVYKAVFVLKDPDNYEWAFPAAEQAIAFSAMLYDGESELAAGEASVDWNIIKAVVTATRTGEELPVFTSDSFKGSLAETVVLKYYTDAGCTNEIAADGIAGGITYYVKAELTDTANFEMDETALAFSSPFEYTVSATFWDNVTRFLGANWWWIAIAAAALILLVLLIILAVRHSKKKAARLKAEAEAREKEELEERRRAEEREERRRKEELEEKKRAEEEERRRREEEREERRLEREARMQSYAMPQMPVMPQMQAPVQSAPASAPANNDAIMASIRAEFDKLRAEQNASKMELELAKMRIEQQAAKEINNARMEAEFAKLRAEQGQPYNPNVQNGANVLGGLLVAALRKYAADAQGMPIMSPEEKLALPESNIVSGVSGVNNVVPGAITTTTTTTTVDASGRGEEKPATTVVENIPEAEGLFNRRGRKKSDGYDPDNFYNFFDEQEKKDK